MSLVAQIARYHRKAPPEPDHADFHALPPSGQKQVMILGGILRVADALDRTHVGKIERLEASFTEKAILIRVKPTGAWKTEHDMVEAKRDMLERAAGRPVLCEEL